MTREEAFMPSDSEKRAAILAVSRFGADRQRVQTAYQAVQQAHAQGKTADLLELLVGQALLTRAQALELRNALDVTQVDPNQPQRPKSRTPATPTTSVSAPTRDGIFELNTLGRYRILRRLGEGGMGSVYLGYLEEEDQQVAIKVLADQLASNHGYVERFYREAKSGSLLSHPNIVRCITVGQDKPTGKHYLVMEFVDGPSAHALLDCFGKLPVADAVHVVLDIAHALEHAHSRNIVHRDIKPDNILITRAGLAKLADLGLSKRTDENSHLTGTRQAFGTPHYMPYEQAVNAKLADGRSDIYALGATLYHLVTGEVPFPGDSHLEVVDKKEKGTFVPASRINPEVPPVLDRILNKMLAREARDRYQTASELIIDLERSHLAAAVPSFVDPDQALRDPTVRARLTSPTEATRPDLEAPVGHGLIAGGEIWSLRYRGEDGRRQKALLSTDQIHEQLSDGRLPPDAEVILRGADGYQPMSRIPEFRQAVDRAQRRLTLSKVRTTEFCGRAPAKGPRSRGWRWLWFGMGGFMFVAAMTFVVWKLVA
jgi:serine/threonine-protein kinase